MQLLQKTSEVACRYEKNSQQAAKPGAKHWSPSFKFSPPPPLEDQAPRRGLPSESPARTRPEFRSGGSPGCEPSLQPHMEDNESLSLATEQERAIFTHPQPQKTVITQSCEPLSLRASAHSLGPSHLSISSRSSRKIWASTQPQLNISPYVDNKICTNEIRRSCV